MLHLMLRKREPTPEDTAWRWAWYYARRHLGRTVVAAVVAPLVAATVGALFKPLPLTAATNQRLHQAWLSAVIVFILVVVLVGAYSLLMAPYQQRNAARDQVKERDTELDGLKSAPMEASHAQLVKDGVSAVLRSLEQNVFCQYRDDYDKKVFLTHLRQSPETLQLLSEWDGLTQELGAIRERVQRFVTASAERDWDRTWHPHDIGVYGFEYIDAKVHGTSTSRAFYLVGPRIVLGTSLGGSSIMDLPDMPTDRAEAELDRLNAWLVRIYDSDPVTEWRGLLDRRQEVRDLLRHQLRPLLSSPLRADRCGELCRPRCYTSRQAEPWHSQPVLDRLP
jgi:hypothetical protein